MERTVIASPSISSFWRAVLATGTANHMMMYPTMNIRNVLAQMSLMEPIGNSSSGMKSMSRMITGSMLKYLPSPAHTPPSLPFCTSRYRRFGMRGSLFSGSVSAMSSAVPSCLMMLQMSGSCTTYFSSCCAESMSSAMRASMSAIISGPSGVFSYAFLSDDMYSSSLV